MEEVMHGGEEAGGGGGGGVLRRGEAISTRISCNL